MIRIKKLPLLLILFWFNYINALSVYNLTTSDITSTSMTIFFASSAKDGVFTVALSPLKYTSSCYLNDYCQKASGLTPSTSYLITVIVSLNSDQSLPMSITQSTLSAVTTPALEASKVGSSIEASFPSTGGGGVITYSVQVGNLLPKYNGTASTCTFTNGLVYGTTYTVQANSSNDGWFSTPAIKTVNYWDPPNMNSINSVSFGTTWFIVGYTQAFGKVLGGGTYNFVVLPGGIVPSSCLTSTSSQCNITGLQAGTQVTVLVSVTNNGETSLNTTAKTTLYQSISYVQVGSSYNQVTRVSTISFSSNGGIPGQTRYSVSRDIQPVASCQSISTTTCPISNLDPGNYTIIVTASNDGLTIQSSSTPLNIPYLPISGVSITTISTINSIQVSWNGTSGGTPGMITYTLSMSMDLVAWWIVCGPISSTSCTATNLLQNTTYNIKVDAVNSITTSSNGMATTLVYQGPNNCLTGTTVCSDHGTCPNGECLCNNGWDGQLCNIPKDNSTTVIVANPKQPEIGFGTNTNDLIYSFKFNQLVELDIDSSIIKSLNLTTLQWKLTQQSNTTIINNNNNGSAIKHSWSYNANVSSEYAQGLSVTFIQFQATNQTIGDSMPMEFAGDKFLLKIGSFKYSMNVSHWNFTSRLNSLELYTDIVTPPQTGCNAVQLTEGPTSTTISVGQSNGAIIYGRLVNRVLIDGVPRTVRHRLEGGLQGTNITSVITDIPYFNQEVQVDPNFSVLVNAGYDPNSCSPSSSSINWRIPVAVVGGAVGVTALITTTAFVFKKYRLTLKYKLWKLGKTQNN